METKGKGEGQQESTVAQPDEGFRFIANNKNRGGKEVKYNPDPEGDPVHEEVRNTKTPKEAEARLQALEEAYGGGIVRKVEDGVKIQILLTEYPAANSRRQFEILSELQNMGYWRAIQ